MASQLRLSALKWPQEETSGVIVISVQVVPDEWGALEDRLHLSQAVYRQFPGDYLIACESEGKRLTRGSLKVFEKEPVLPSHLRETTKD